MKKNQIKFILILCISTFFVNCKKKVIEEEPIVYDFTKDFKDKVQLPQVNVTKPDTVKVKPASVTESPTSKEVFTSLLDKNPKIEDKLTKASESIDKALSDDQAKKLDNAFTPDVIEKLAKGTPLSSIDKESAKLIDDILKTGVLKDFALVVTLPTVNNVTVGGRKAASEGSFNFNTKLNVNFSNANTQDECADAAKKAFDDVKKVLDQSNTDLKAKIEGPYNTNVSDLKAKAAKSKTDITAKYKGLRDEATLIYNASNAALNSLPLPAILKNITRITILMIFVDKLNTYNTLVAADSKAIDTALEKNLLSAKEAKDKDLATLKTAYDVELKKLTDAINKIPCHNQGK